jgi:protein-L-isoaspartate(D-aspartate) O-methyltransferase
MSRVDEAFQNVNRDEFVLREDGTVVMQSTSNKGIKESLEMLNVQEGDRVLEIGTGSGFSTALLSYLVGSSGYVVSIDIEPEMTARAKKLFEQKNITNVRFETKDGRKGDQESAPYSHIVAWATAEYLPSSWVDQLRDQGTIVAPFLVGEVAGSMFVCQMKKEGNELIGKQIRSGGYILMNDTPEYESYGHELAADVKEMNGIEASAWASAKWLRKQTEEQRKKFLKQFIQQELEKLTLKLNREEEQGFRAYLFSQQKEGLTTALRERTAFIGYSDEHQFALFSPSHSLLVANGEAARLVLRTWLDEWKKLREPSIEKMIPVIRQDGNKAVVGLAMLR